MPITFTLYTTDSLERTIMDVRRARLYHHALARCLARGDVGLLLVVARTTKASHTMVCAWWHIHR